MVDFILKIVGYIFGYTICLGVLAYSIILVIAAFRLGLGKDNSPLPKIIRKTMRKL